VGESAVDLPDDFGKFRDKVNKLYGTGTVRLATERLPWRHIPTGVFTVDMALFGGIPRSQITLILGKEAAGKTTLATKVMANAQSLFPESFTALVQPEGTYDYTWGEKLGIDNNRLICADPSTAEQALDIAEEFLRKPYISVVVLDSVAALSSYRELENSAEDVVPGILARLVNAFCRKATATIVDQRKKGHFPALILLNQWRNTFVLRGDPRVVPGGKGQHIHAFSRLEILNREVAGTDETDHNTVDYNEHVFHVTKNKEGVGLRNGEFRMIRNPSHPLGQGFIEDGRTAVTWGKNFGLTTGGGGKLRLDGTEETFRTMDDAADWLHCNPEFYFGFKNKIISSYRKINGLNPDGWL